MWAVLSVRSVGEEVSMVTIIDVPVSRIIDGKFIGAKRGPRESVVSRFRFPIPL